MIVEDEKGYEIAKNYLRKKYGDDYVDFLETEGQSYLDGIAEGRKDVSYMKAEEYDKYLDVCRENEELKLKNEALEEFNTQLIKYAEKLHCCGNCKWYRIENGGETYCDCVGDCIGFDKWE